MFKIFSLAKSFIRPQGSIFPAFQFQTMKQNLNLIPSLLKIQDLNYKPRNFVGNHYKKPSEKPFKHWRIIKGDKVIVRSGKDQGKEGTVYRVYRSQNKVLVSGINLVNFQYNYSKKIKVIYRK